MELLNDVDIQLAAAIACYFQNIRNCQRVISQNAQQSQVFQTIKLFARDNLATRNTTSNSSIYNVDCRAVLSQPCSRNRQNRTSTRAPTTEILIPAKIAEWKNKLDHLSFLFNSIYNGTMSSNQICADLHMEFRDLITFLCYTSSTKRPVIIFALVEVYAGSLVKLHQYYVVGTDNGSERLLYAAIHEVISFWLQFLHRNNVNKYDRFWLHTRAVITRMFKNIVIQECILAVKHSLASMLKELTMLVLESGEHSYGFYACEQIEYLMTVLSYQTSYVRY